MQNNDNVIRSTKAVRQTFGGIFDGATPERGRLEPEGTLQTSEKEGSGN